MIFRSSSSGICNSGSALSNRGLFRLSSCQRSNHASHRYISSAAAFVAAQPVQAYASIGLSSYGVSSRSRRTGYQAGCGQSGLAEDICSVAPCWSIYPNTLSRSR